MPKIKDAKGAEMKHTQLLVDSENGGIHLVYHETAVMSLLPTGVTLRDGGWQTTTTLRRINQGAEIFRIPLSVYLKDGKWIIRFGRTGMECAFEDGMEFPPGALGMSVAEMEDASLHVNKTRRPKDAATSSVEL
jgi:hypothetical protein|tara:strand:+ start:31009 stop:31410 length:402 start_codon:yes stop_codon:yes gene_type:complete